MGIQLSTAYQLHEFVYSLPIARILIYWDASGVRVGPNDLKLNLISVMYTQTNRFFNYKGNNNVVQEYKLSEEEKSREVRPWQQGSS